MLSDSEQLYLMHLAALIGVAALTFRNQLILRAVLLVSIVFSIVDHVFVRQGANPNYVFWDLVALVINSWMLVRLVLDRTHVGLTDEEERLFQTWGSLSPGEFRQLLRLAHWRTATESMELTCEGELPDNLFYVIEGDLQVVKAGRTVALAAPAFIGEVAFVKERPASATVLISPGGRYVVWSAKVLRQYFARNQAMRVAAMRIISADMAGKVARA